MKAWRLILVPFLITLVLSVPHIQRKHSTESSRSSMATRFSCVHPMDGSFLNVEIIEQDYGFFKTDTRNPFIPYRGQML